MACDDGRVAEVENRVADLETAVPGGWTDHALIRGDGTTKVQGSGIICDDSNNLTGLATLTGNGALDLYANNNTTGGAGYATTVLGGNGDTNKAGGSVTIQGGTGDGTATGGLARVNGGDGGATGDGQDAYLQGGSGGGTSGDGGDAICRGGAPTSGVGGGVQIIGRAGVGTNKDGGSVTITAGAATGIGTPGTISLAVPAATNPISVTGTITDANCTISGGTVSSAGTNIKVKAETGPASDGDAVAQEMIVDTTNAGLYVSRNGTTVDLIGATCLPHLYYPTTHSGTSIALSTPAGSGDSNSVGIHVPFDAWVIASAWVIDVNASSSGQANLRVRRNAGSSWVDLLIVATGVLSVANGQRFSGTAVVGTHAVSAGDVVQGMRTITAGTLTTDDMKVWIWIVPRVTGL